MAGGAICITIGRLLATAAAASAVVLSSVKEDSVLCLEVHSVEEKQDVVDCSQDR